MICDGADFGDEPVLGSQVKMAGEDPKAGRDNPVFDTAQGQWFGSPARIRPALTLLCHRIVMGILASPSSDSSSGQRAGAGHPATAPAWRDIALKGVLASAIMLILYLAFLDLQWPFPRDTVGYVLGRDFLNFWTMGREAWSDDPGRFYNMADYVAFLHNLLGSDYPYQQWSYPPSVMVPAAPFGLLPYLPAYFLWTALGIAACLLAVRTACKQAWTSDPKTAALAVALAPAALVCLVSGQNSFFTAAIFIAVFRWWDSRPVAAGILIGLLTLKPQLGLLFPVLLLVSRRWTVMAAAAATALVLAGLTAGLFGPEIWLRYFTIGVTAQEGVLDDPSPIIMGLMPTIFMDIRLLGGTPALAYAVQVVAGLGAAAMVAWAYWRRRDPVLSYALFLTASLLATPYLMSYDMVVFGWVLLATGASLGASRGGRLALTGIYWLPLVALPLGVSGIPGAALVPVVFIVIVTLRLRAADGARPETIPAAGPAAAPRRPSD